MMEKCTGSWLGIRLRMQWPSHWLFVVAHQTAHGGQGIVFKQHPACIVHLVCLEQTDDLGILVWMGQPS